MNLKEYIDNFAIELTNEIKTNFSPVLIENGDVSLKLANKLNELITNYAKNKKTTGTLTANLMHNFDILDNYRVCFLDFASYMISRLVYDNTLKQGNKLTTLLLLANFCNAICKKELDYPLELEKKLINWQKENDDETRINTIKHFLQTFLNNNAMLLIPKDVLVKDLMNKHLIVNDSLKQVAQKLQTDLIAKNEKFAKK